MISKFKDFYVKNYKVMVLFTLTLLFLAIFQIGYQTYTTGNFLNKGISLKGGITLNLMSADLNEAQMQSALAAAFPKSDLEVRSLSTTGKDSGLSVKIDLDVNNKEDLAKFKQIILIAAPSLAIKDIEENMQTISPQLGDSFFRGTFKSMILAFIFMALVVVYFFRSFVPSGAVILCAFSDIIITLAMTNLLGMKISTAGITAFLMLIGYSVDTDILLTTKVLKGTQGTVVDRIFKAMGTGLTMTTTTMAAVLVAIFFTISPEIKQIMTILLIGLVVDIIMTWIQNGGVLMYFRERRTKKEAGT